MRAVAILGFAAIMALAVLVAMLVWHVGEVLYPRLSGGYGVHVAASGPPPQASLPEWGACPGRLEPVVDGMGRIKCAPVLIEPEGQEDRP